MKKTLINIDRIERIEIHTNEIHSYFKYDPIKKKIYTNEYINHYDDHPTKEYYDDFNLKANNLYLKDECVYILPYIIMKFSNDSIKEYFNNENELDIFLKHLEKKYNFKSYDISICNEIIK